jgi:hypothetical protein
LRRASRGKNGRAKRALWYGHDALSAKVSRSGRRHAHFRNAAGHNRQSGQRPAAR